MVAKNERAGRAARRYARPEPLRDGSFQCGSGAVAECAPIDVAGLNSDSEEAFRSVVQRGSEKAVPAECQDKGARGCAVRGKRRNSFPYRDAMQVAKRRGQERTKVALARQLGMILHRVWVDGSEFLWSRDASVAVVA